MKDYTIKQLEATRPDKDALYLIHFCLKQLYKDKKHNLCENISEANRHSQTVGLLTYEELIGALLQARDELKFYEDRKSW